MGTERAVPTMGNTAVVLLLIASGATIFTSRGAGAVTALNPFLKKTCIVLKAPLNGKVPDEVTIGAEVLEQLGGGSNMTIEGQPFQGLCALACMSTRAVET